ncbi:MAG TPA: sigma-70 family RNA polymerase sigma factor [Nannocystaceae bacterium]|nr:sigma-70 family RNA polymerase sigma factor [Nannocystaceae bacterium]
MGTDRPTGGDGGEGRGEPGEARAAARRAIEAVWRVEAPRITGALARMLGDLDRAEDLVQHALMVALERWPATGIPESPGAWLLTVARNRARDELRRGAMKERRHGVLTADAEADAGAGELEARVDDVVGDDVLRLVLATCHPILPRASRVALTLRLVGGLTTEEVARALLVAEPTLAQRLVRAKRTLAEARVPFEVPRGEALRPRVEAALEVIYLIFNEGYAATRGDVWIRVDLCDEALRLARVVAALVPDDAEAHGLCALLELQASRARARVAPDGEPILLADQDRSRWDRLLIARGLASLARAEALARPLGPYALQAAIAAAHARAPSVDATEWPRIVALYDALVELTGSPVVELNRAVAVSMAHGPEEALPLVDALADDPALRGYHLLPVVRADLLARLGRRADARAALHHALALCQNASEEALLRRRLAALAAAEA